GHAYRRLRPHVQPGGPAEDHRAADRRGERLRAARQARRVLPRPAGAHALLHPALGRGPDQGRRRGGGAGEADRRTWYPDRAGTGLDLGTGTQNSSVKGTVFTDISGNGLAVSGVDLNLPTNAADHTSGNTIADNWFHHLPVEYHGGVAIQVGYAEQTTIAHN